MNEINNKVVIIGSGITGMAAAKRLIDKNGFDPNQILIIEKENESGGLLRTSQKKGSWWDNGVFFFHHNSTANNQHHIYDIMPEKFYAHQYSAEKAWYMDQMQPYPFSAKKLFSSIPITNQLFFPFVFFFFWIRRNFIGSKQNLRIWINDRLTPVIYKVTGLEEYIYKLMGLTPDKLSHKFGEDRLAFIDDMSKPSRFIQSTINNKFRSDSTNENVFKIFYPNGKGVGEISKEFADGLLKKGIRIEYNAKLKKISKADNGYYLSYLQNNQTTSIFTENIISTIPLESLLPTLQPMVSANLIEESKKLQYRSLLLIFITINGSIIDNEAQVIYSLSQSNVWKRLFIRKFPDKTCSVSIEVPFNKDKKINTKEIFASIKNDLVNELKLFKKDQIILDHHTVVENAYPVAFTGYEKCISKIKEVVESNSFQTAGRQGNYNYCNVKGSIKSGYKSADNIIHSTFDH